MTNLNESIDALSEAGILIWTRADGRSVGVPLGSGFSPDGFSARVVADSSGFRVFETTGMITTFDAGGRLRSKTQNGHGLAQVVYSDEGAQADCPGTSEATVCKLVDTRGVVVNVSWSQGTISRIVVAPGSPDEWVVVYGAASVESPASKTKYTYDGTLLTSITQEQGSGQPDRVLETHSYFGSDFPRSLQGRAREAIGPNSALGFHWGGCNLEDPSPLNHWCTIGGYATNDAMVFDLRRALQPEEGAPCNSDDGCTYPQVCTFFQEVTTGQKGRCRLPQDTVTLKGDRVVHRTDASTVCNGAVSNGWNDINGTKDYSIDERGLVTTFQYANGLLMKEVKNDDDLDPSTLPYSSDSRVVTFGYQGGTGRVQSISETSNVDPTLTRVRAVEYDSSGRPAALVESGLTLDPSGSNSFSVSTRRTEFTYEDGLLRTIDGPRTDIPDIVTFDYYPADAPSLNDRLRVREICRNTGAPPSAKLCTRLSNYDLWGNARSVSEVDGTLTGRVFDSSGRLLEEHRDVGGIEAISRRTYYRSGLLRTLEQPGGGCYSAEYGAFGTLVSLTYKVNCEAGSAPLWVEDVTADSFGRALESKVVVDQQIRNRRTVERDDRGRIVELFKPDLAGSPHSHIQYDIAGFPTVQEDEDCWPIRLPSCQKLQYHPAGAWGSVESLERFGPDGPSGRYQYDRDGNAAVVFTSSNNVYRYQYDDFGQLVRIESPDAGLNWRHYDEAGNMTREEFSDGRTATRTFDAINRLTAETTGDDIDCSTAPDGVDVSRLRLLYDESAPNSACAGCGHLSGRLSRTEVEHFCDVRASTGRFATATEYGYDGLGNVVAKVDYANVNEPGYGTWSLPERVSLSYRLDSQVDTTTYPDGQSFRYEYDSAGLTTGIRDLETNELVVSDVEYHDPVARTLASWHSNVRME